MLNTHTHTDKQQKKKDKEEKKQVKQIQQVNNTRVSTKKTKTARHKHEACEQQKGQGELIIAQESKKGCREI